MLALLDIRLTFKLKGRIIFVGVGTVEIFLFDYVWRKLNSCSSRFNEWGKRYSTLSTISLFQHHYLRMGSGLFQKWWKLKEKFVIKSWWEKKYRRTIISTNHLTQNHRKKLVEGFLGLHSFNETVTTLL